MNQEPTVKQPLRESPVSSEMLNLMDKIGFLSEITTELEERLGLVLSPSMPIEGSTSQENDAQGASPIANQLFRAAADVDTVAQRLRVIRNRAEV